MECRILVWVWLMLSCIRRASSVSPAVFLAFTVTRDYLPPVSGGELHASAIPGKRSPVRLSSNRAAPTASGTGSETRRIQPADHAGRSTRTSRRGACFAVAALLLTGVAEGAERRNEAAAVTERSRALLAAHRHRDAHRYLVTALTKASAAGPLPVEWCPAMRAAGDVCSMLRNEQEAVHWYRKCLATLERQQPPDVRARVNIMRRLARAMGPGGRHEERLKLVRQTEALVRKHIGANTEDAAGVMLLEGEVLTDMGRTAEAEAKLRQAIRAAESAGPSATATQAVGLLFHARVLDDLGRLSEVEPRLTRAIRLMRRVWGEDAQQVAAALSDLGTHYRRLGKLDQAGATYREALAIMTKRFGPDHPESLTVASNLSAVDFDAGRFDRAQTELKRILQARIRRFGETHPIVARTYDALGDNYQNLQRLDEAEACYRRSLASQPQSSLAGAKTELDLLTIVFQRGGQVPVARAEALLAALQRACGETSQDVLRARILLFFFLAAEGRHAAAWKHAEAIVRLEQRHARGLLSFADERVGVQYLSRRGWVRNALLSYVLQCLPSDRDAVTTAANTMLNAKGQILDGMVRRRQVATDPASRQALAQLAQLRTSIAASAWQDSPAAAAHRQQLQQQAAALETALARRVGPGALAPDAVDVAAIRQRLGPGVAAIEYVRPPWANFQGRTREDRWQPARYVAVIIRAEAETPGLVDLGEAKRIDELVAEFRKAVVATATHRGLKLARSRRSQARERVADAAVALHDAVLAPLAAELEGATELILSPAGDLSMVPFEALHGRGDSPVAVRTVTRYVSAVRDLVRPGSPAATRHAGAVVIGDPAYDVAHSGAAPPTPERSAGMDTAHFAPLPGTAVEAEAIAKLLRKNSLAVQAWTADEATETKLKQIKSPRVLHIATHGFFLPGPAMSSLERDGWMSFSQPSPSAVENPLLRCGLALAGANRWREGGRDDGLLTALEACDLDLQGTELVCLSACETGLGQVQFGEGVFGLRRAIEQAGARSLIMSLWVVADRETVDLMSSFYRHWLGGDTQTDALRKARLAMIAQLEQERGYAHPFYWAPFVLVGAPR